MEKMFKRSILGAAVAFAAVSGSANAAIDLNGEAVQLYGQAAGSILITNQSDKVVGGVTQDSDTSVMADMESRIGFRGRVAFDEFGPDLVWQIESGNANGVEGQGYFGFRDTFVGFDFDGIGSFKYGRQLVATYNYVDWPHSNPGLGNVFDWNNDIGAAFEDRASNNLRFDSASFGGFNVQATLSGMGTTSEALVSSIAASYSMDMFSVHAGMYKQKAYDIDVAAVAAGKPTVGVAPDGSTIVVVPGSEAVAATTKQAGDLSYSILGGSVFLGDITLTAAWKYMENGATNGLEKKSQDAYSATAQYILDSTYVFKIGYAGTTDSNGRAVNVLPDADTAITGRLGYLLPSAYLYFDVRNYDMKYTDDKGYTQSKFTNFLLGAEYYF